MSLSRNVKQCLVLALFVAMFGVSGVVAQLSTSAQVSGPPASCTNSGTTSASCSSVLGLPLYPGTFGGSASASASYGKLGTFASAITACNLAPGQNCAVLQVATSSADFFDTLTLTNAPASGSVIAALQISGMQTVSCSGPSCGNAQTQAALGVSGVVFPQGALLPLGSGVTYVNVPVPFVSSSGTVAIPWGFSLEATASCYADDTTSCSDFSDFSHTVIVTGATVVDANGNPVPGATITSGSGTNYNAASGTVTFAAFTAKLEREGKTGFELASHFTLGAGSAGINPATESVSFQAGPLSGTIASGRFKNHNGSFEYEGVIGSSDVEITIKPVSGNQYSFSMEASNVILPGGTPITIGLTIGNDTGMTTAIVGN